MKQGRWIVVAGLVLGTAMPSLAQYGGSPPTSGGGSGGGSAPSAGGASSPSTPGVGAPAPSGANPGPRDTVPSGGARPSTPAPAGPVTPPSGAPGGLRPLSPSTPGVIPNTPGSLGGPQQPRSPRGNGVTPDDPASWRVWWTLNHDRFVDVAATAPTAANDGEVAVGHTKVLAEVRADAYERLLPIVRRAVQSETNEILLGRALIALGKLGEDPRIANSREVYKLILPFVSHAKTRVAESAAVALGILGHEESVTTLAQFAAPAQGSGVERDLRVRTFAIYGLGLVARDAKREDVRRVAASRICAIFAAEKGQAVDVKAACLQALSLVPLAGDTQAMVVPGEKVEVPSASRSAEIDWVLRVLDDDAEATWVRAQAATTAARLCADQPEHSKLRARVTERLLEALEIRSRDGLPMRQSAALALGILADGDADAHDEAVRDALSEAMVHNADQATRFYAAMGLAQAASRPGGPSQDSGRLIAASEVRAQLIRRLGSGSETDRAWAAISLGVFEHRMRQAGEPASADSQAALMAVLDAAHSPEIGGASCLALGLSGALQAEELLNAQLKSGDPHVRGFAATALGMIGAKDSIAALERLLDKADAAPECYVPISEALALLGQNPSQRIVKSLVGGPGLEAQLAACMALGRTGGAKAVQPLTDLAGDATGTTWVRAMAIEALGSIGDHGATRWNARYAFDTNFLALPLTATAPTLDGLLDLE